MALTPPSMVHVPFTVKFVVVSRIVEAALAAELEVINVLPVPNVKNELVAPPLRLLVTNRLWTPSVPPFNVSEPEPLPAPTLRMPILVTVAPVMLTTLPVAAPLPMVMA